MKFIPFATMSRKQRKKFQKCCDYMNEDRQLHGDIKTNGACIKQHKKANGIFGKMYVIGWRAATTIGIWFLSLTFSHPSNCFCYTLPY